MAKKLKLNIYSFSLLDDEFYLNKKIIVNRLIIIWMIIALFITLSINKDI